MAANKIPPSDLLESTYIGKGNKVIGPRQSKVLASETKHGKKAEFGTAAYESADDPWLLKQK
jgi:hypothetical protein